MNKNNSSAINEEHFSNNLENEQAEIAKQNEIVRREVALGTTIQILNMPNSFKVKDFLKIAKRIEDYIVSGNPET